MLLIISFFSRRTSLCPFFTLQRLDKKYGSVLISGFKPSHHFFGARDHVLKIVVNEYDDRCTFDELIGLV